MGIIQFVKNLFKRGQYAMTTESLASITDHPKIAVTSAEYRRINENLRYYQSNIEKITYTNTDGVKKQREATHLPIARTAAKKIASLVFNEQASIKLDDKEANTFIQETLKNDRFNKNFERYLESCLALGGLAMRPYVDNGRVRVSFIQAPVFLPLQSNTQDISSAAIVTKTIKASGQKNIYYTLIEFHEWAKDGKYIISNELYRSESSEQVGGRVPLAEVYEDLEEQVELDGLTRPLFSYLKPPGMNNKDINSPLGLSIFDNAKSTIDFINTTYDEFKWEVKMGQRRVAVPENLTEARMVNQDGDVQLVKRFDTEQNVYLRLSTSDMDGGSITDLTTAIRADDYIKTINLYPTKAKRIIALSKILIDHYHSEVPHDRTALESLPGVGRKTANVVLNVGFGEPAIAVDTHILRTAPRIGLSSGTTPLEVEQDLLRITPEEFLLDAHHWILLHGRYVCKARNPDCAGCSLNDICLKNGVTV